MCRRGSLHVDVGVYSLAKEFVVVLTNLRGLVIIEKGQECVATAARDARDGVKQAARKNNGTTWGRLVAPRPVLREAHLARFELGVQIDGNGETAMRSPFSGIIQGRSVLRSVTGDLGFPRAEMSESIRDNPNRRLSHAGVAIGDFALDP